MSPTQPVPSPTDPAVQPAASAGPLPPPRPGSTRTEAQQVRVTILMDLMSKLVEHMDTFSAIQIQNPHVPQTATQVKDILAVLLPEITTMGPLLLEREQTQVMGMLHHVTQRVDAVWKAQVQTQTNAEAQAALDAANVMEANQEALARKGETKRKESNEILGKSDEGVRETGELIARRKEIEVAALKAKAVMQDTLSDCLAELNNDLRVEMKKKYM
ncbi:hypothetical protein GGF44_001824 [Coemansia sp. RSA 1694]|nr:hypothetical protein GGF44_001824 [Coemansia sp. RSA 1694]